MSRVTVVVTIILIVCFRHISMNISLNFICFIIENCLYYFHCACKLLKIKLMNLGCLELLFLLPLSWLLVYGDFFFVSFVSFLVILLLLHALNCFVYCSNRPNLLLIEKLINLIYLNCCYWRCWSLLLPITLFVFCLGPPSAFVLLVLELSSLCLSLSAVFMAVLGPSPLPFPSFIC